MGRPSSARGSSITSRRAIRVNVSRKRIASSEDLAAVRALALHNKQVDRSYVFAEVATVHFRSAGTVVGLPLAGGAISRMPVGKMETLQGVVPQRH